MASRTERNCTELKLLGQKPTPGSNALTAPVARDAVDDYVLTVGISPEAVDKHLAEVSYAHLALMLIVKNSTLKGV